MNRVFEKQKFIGLDEKWDLTPDADHGVVLTFKEARIRIKENTGEKEEFLFVDKYYFPRVAQALSKYCEMSLNHNESIDDIVSNSERIFNLINTIKDEFR